MMGTLAVKGLILPITKYVKDEFKRSCEGFLLLFFKLLLHLGIGGHGDCSTKLFDGHIRYCNGRWPMTVYRPFF